MVFESWGTVRLVWFPAAGAGMAGPTRALRTETNTRLMAFVAQNVPDLWRIVVLFLQLPQRPRTTFPRPVNSRASLIRPKQAMAVESRK
jgi:hypothetical protein